MPEVETEQDRVNIRGKNKSKNFLTYGGILFSVTMIFGLSTANTEAVLRAKKLTGDYMVQKHLNG